MGLADTRSMNNSQSTACSECERLRRRVAELEERGEKLSAALEEALRAAKRQAAPFRKKKGKKNSGSDQNKDKRTAKRPGRKKGDQHGEHAHRKPPAPDQVDERHDAPLPDQCPCCGGGHLHEDKVMPQFQVEIPRKPIHRQFDVHVGHCRDCGTRLQGRHPLQTSDALGAAAAQLGPDAHATLNLLNKRMGLSHGKCSQLFGDLFGITVARSTSVRSALRTTIRLEPAYQQILDQVLLAPWNVCDETGWRMNGENAWLHVAVSPDVTCYVIDPRRGHDVLAQILGLDYDGILIHDGWAAYNCFDKAQHQQCLAHLLRRSHELLETAVGEGVRFLQGVTEILQEALTIRDRFFAGDLTLHGVASLRGRLTQQLRYWLAPEQDIPEHERFAAHLHRHLEHLFTFLAIPGLDATNWRAEQAIRPAVVNRKVWGGNRTTAGAKAQAILTSILVTCQQQARSALDFLSEALTSPSPLLLFNST